MNGVILSGASGCVACCETGGLGGLELAVGGGFEGEAVTSSLGTAAEAAGATSGGLEVAGRARW